MAIRIPSVERIITSFVQTIMRFPFETFVAFIGTCAFYYLVTDDSGHRMVYTKLMLTATLGLVFYLSAGLYVRSTGKGNIFYYAMQILVTALLTTYYFSLPDFIQDTHMQKHAILSAVGHLAVSFAPFLHQRNVNALAPLNLRFWHYNKILFIRILTSGLYSVVLFGGLAGVLGSLDALFGINIDSDTYVILACTIFGMFNTLFFLSGVPEQPESADEGSSYPIGLSMFTQYVLIPLVSIYMAILFAYEVKILVTFNLPKGWISALIIAFSIVGILANLLVYPLRENSDKGWIRFFARWFYLLLLPLLILFYWAVLYRISEYGFTEERYYLLITAIWLTGISLYFVFSRNKNILFIPITLALLGLFSQFSGPLSASAISLNSQLTRLEKLLNDEEIKTDGNKQKEAIQIMKYCMQSHGRQSMVSLFGEDADTLFEEKDSERNYRYVMDDECIDLLKLKGISYVAPRRNNDDEEAYQNVTTEYIIGEDDQISISGYSSMFDIETDEVKTVKLSDGNNLEINTNDYSIIEFKLNGKNVHTISLITLVKQLDAKLEGKNKADKQELFSGKSAESDMSIALKPEQLTFPMKITDQIEIAMVFQQVMQTENLIDSSSIITNWSGKVLIK